MSNVINLADHQPPMFSWEESLDELAAASTLALFQTDPKYVNSLDFEEQVVKIQEQIGGSTYIIEDAIKTNMKAFFLSKGN